MGVPPHHPHPPYTLRACARVWEKAVWDQTCPLHCYTNTKRTNSKWHLNWSRWKALWTGSKGWYFHAGVKTNPLPLPLSPLSLFLLYVRPRSECIPGTAAPAMLSLTCPGSWSTNLGDNHWKGGCRSYLALCAVSSLVWEICPRRQLGNHP